MDGVEGQMQVKSLVEGKVVAVKAAVVVVGGRAFEGEDLAFHESKCEYSAMSFKISYHSLLVTLVLKWRGIMYTFRYMND